MQPVLLDTCAAIWLSEGQRVKPEAIALLNAAHVGGASTYVSPITAWEIGMLASRDKLRLLITPENWFARLVELPGMMLAEMSPAMLIASSFLPGKPPRDPADRIIVATARDLGATLLTRDGGLLSYGKQGHLNVVAC